MENENQGVHLVLLTRKPMEFTIDEFLTFLKEPIFFVIVAFAILVDYTLMVPPIDKANGNILSLVFWAVAVIVTIFVYFGTLLLFCTTSIGPSTKPVFEPFIALLAAITSSVFVGPFYLQTNTIASLDISITLEAMVSMFFALEIGVLCYVYSLRPTILERLAKAKPEAPASGPTSFRIGGETFSAARLRYVKSENQYIHIFTDFDDTLLLGALKDVSKQIDDQLGMIVHRSYYVMRREVKNIEKNGSEQALILSDDTRIPLARRRSTDVKTWLDAN